MKIIIVQQNFFELKRINWKNCDTIIIFLNYMSGNTPLKTASYVIVIIYNFLCTTQIH